MRKLILVLALASAALPLGACQTVRTVDQAVTLANQNVGDFTIADERGWFYAEALYNVPTVAYLSANRRGLFAGHADLKATIKADLQELNRLRVAVRQAYRTSNSVTFREKIAQMKVLSDQVRRLVPSITAQAVPVAIPSDVLAARVAAS